MTKSKPKKSILRTSLEVCLMLVLVFFAILVSELIVAWIMALILGDKADQPLPLAIFSALSYVLAIVIIIWLPPFIKAKREKSPKALVSRAELGLHGYLTWTDVGLSLVGFVAYFVLASALTALFSSLMPWFDASEAQEVGFNVHSSGIDRLIAFFALVVVAPIAEEVIFRGWLYGKMRAKLTGVMPNVYSVIISTILTSLAFGLVHMQWNVGVNVFAMSIVLCLMREVTGTIYADILVHMLKNGIAFYLLFILGIS